MSSRDLEAQKLQKEWSESPRWRGIKRGYTAEDVVRLRGSLQVEHTLARRGSEKLWKLLNEEPFVISLGALTHSVTAFDISQRLTGLRLG